MPVADRRQGHDGGSVNIRAPQQKTRFCCSLVGVLAGIVARSDIHVGRLLVLPKPIQHVGSGSCLVNLGSG